MDNLNYQEIQDIIKGIETFQAVLVDKINKAPDIYIKKIISLQELKNKMNIQIKTRY